MKLLWEEDGFDEELLEFYDFSQSWPTEEGEQQQQQQLIQVNHESYVKDGEWHLPSGTVIGHRSLQRYYQQRLRPSRDEPESVVLSRMNQQLLRYKQAPVGLSDVQIKEKLEKREMQKVWRERKHKDMQLGVRTNGLQRHFRQQVDF